MNRLYAGFLVLLPAAAVAGLAANSDNPFAAEMAPVPRPAGAETPPEAQHPDPGFRVERFRGSEVVTEVRTDTTIFPTEVADRADRYEGSGLTFAVQPSSTRLVATLTWDDVADRSFQGMALYLYRMSEENGTWMPTGYKAESGSSPLFIDVTADDVAPGLYLVQARTSQDPLVASAAYQQPVQYDVEITYRFVP
ncbi:MAG: hypothetical protein ACT4PT_10245 [Methanobacteriota archaeon]